MLPLTTNLKDAYGNGRDDEQNFIQNLALFLSSFLKEHGNLLEEKVSFFVFHCNSKQNCFSFFHFTVSNCFQVKKKKNDKKLIVENLEFCHEVLHVLVKPVKMLFCHLIYFLISIMENSAKIFTSRKNLKCSLISLQS